MLDKEAFLTNNRRDYKWHLRTPIAPIPSQPPLRTKPNNCYVARLVEPYCHCDFHLYEPEMGRYMKLVRTENHLHKVLHSLSKKMAILKSSVLDHPCDNDDEKMETLFQINYLKKGSPVAKYRKLRAAIDSPFGVPVKGEVLGLGRGYRDPFKFRHSCFPKPRVHPAPCVTYQATPSPVDEWFKLQTGTTEYHDTINHMGYNLIKNRQQYREPLMTSRRTDNEPCR
ncbi:unnamed protein product [Psylliodes chrysocephalus]|uniref:Uncharacterized protein n=1 Tax=Psylliodes chrysocephalus TaxID=3402493 RepID=A0A9P0GA43_9CUCU|nr:unnamed protein product [Psylliodes chrysocephala]